MSAREPVDEPSGSEPADEPGARLFAALRDEPVPEGAERRALLAARAELGRSPSATWFGRPAVWGGVVAAGALAAAILLALRPAAPSAGIRAEPTSAREAPLRVRPAPSAAEAPPSPVSSAPRAPAPPTPSHAPTPVTLADELDALKGASAALNAGDAAGALRALDRYEHSLKGTQLRAEATLLRIQALSKAGQAGAASALAERFVAHNPDSPLVDRARSFMQEK